MDLSAEQLHGRLDLIAEQGWDGPAAVELLQDLRRHVVRPVVRAHRLQGPAADQAEATGWAAAWEAIRRPSAQVAENPAGMVWSAVRRSVATELRLAHRVGIPIGDSAALEAHGAVQPEGVEIGDPAPGGHGDPRATPHLNPVLDLLVRVGWDRAALEELVERVVDRGSGPGWRAVAAATGLPAWQVRRVVLLIQPQPQRPSLLELVVRHGQRVLEHPAAVWAARSTRASWQPGPELSLAMLEAAHASAPHASHLRPGNVTAPQPSPAWTGAETSPGTGVLR